MLGEIMDHSVLAAGCNSQISGGARTYVNSYGVKRRKLTTQGWEIFVEWKDGSTDWVASKDSFKELNPFELTLYVVDRNIKDEPAFA